MMWIYRSMLQSMWSCNDKIWCTLVAVLYLRPVDGLDKIR